jgi:hypothetical protein
MFRHPKYYKELRKLRNKLDQAISTDRSRDKSSVTPIERSPGPGPKRQATSVKPQAASDKQQASSNKLQASGQASSNKR